jgi:triacylglycerol esterase/lipase EstA (alpha/beta hydrolase family)
VLGREIGAVVRQGRLMAFPKRSQPPASADRMVLFVHGFMAGGPVFDPMRAHVESVVAVETVGLTYGPLESFEHIAGRIAALAKLSAHGRPVTIVGHSLGGLLARWYLQELGGAIDQGGAVDRLITIASPHAGTDKARFAPGSLGAALRPGSAIVERLRAGRDRAKNVVHVAVVAGRDQMITPPESAGAIEDAEVHRFDDLGHNAALFDRRVVDLIARKVVGVR